MSFQGRSRVAKSTLICRIDNYLRFAVLRGSSDNQSGGAYRTIATIVQPFSSRSLKTVSLQDQDEDRHVTSSHLEYREHT